jgi:hypothetical protein
MINSLTRSASTSLANLKYTVDPVLERSKRFQKSCSETIQAGNRRFGLPRQQWLEIVQIALRILIPLAVALLTIAIFPPLAVKILFTPILIATILLSAFYGSPEQFEGELDLELDIVSRDMMR